MQEQCLSVTAIYPITRGTPGTLEFLRNIVAQMYCSNVNGQSVVVSPILREGTNYWKNVVYCYSMLNISFEHALKGLQKLSKIGQKGALVCTRSWKS